jgi:nitronate monooxygenase
MVLDEITVPIVLAPLAGGPSTPQLVAAVCEAGGMGTLAGGYLPTSRLADQLRQLRELTDRSFGVNLFIPPAHPADPASYAGYLEELRRWAGDRNLPVGQPQFTDDGFAEKLDLLASDPVPVVSFTFGMPSADVIGRLRTVGSEVWVTVTTPTEAAAALAGGADVLVLQGIQAGGHRGSFDDDERTPGYAVLSLLQLLRGAGRPLVAAGGIVTGAAIAAALAAGARAAQLGTAFLLCPEAGTPNVHRAALRQGGAPTRLTRAFTGRAARGIVNQFMIDHDAHAVSAYPEIHHVTQPLRLAANAVGDASMVNLWAGETYPLIRELPAGALVGLLARELRVALEAASDASR